MDNILNAVIGVSGCLLTTATAQSAVSTWDSGNITIIPELLPPQNCQ